MPSIKTTFSLLSLEVPAVKSAWKEAFQSKRFTGWFVFAFSTTVLLLLFVEWYFETIILNKPGIRIGDFVLDQFPPFDWSLEIMTLIYAGAAISIISNIGNPWRFLQSLSTFAIVTWLRMIGMYVFTLEAPQGVIALSDPFLSLVAYDRSDFVKDLFFSGHISCMCVFITSESRPKLKWLLIAMTITMAILLLWQHVHYTIDVVVAGIVTFTVAAILKKYFLKMPLSN